MMYDFKKRFVTFRNHQNHVKKFYIRTYSVSYWVDLQIALYNFKVIPQ